MDESNRGSTSSQALLDGHSTASHRSLWASLAPALLLVSLIANPFLFSANLRICLHHEPSQYAKLKASLYVPYVWCTAYGGYVRK